MPWTRVSSAGWLSTTAVSWAIMTLCSKPLYLCNILNFQAISATI